MDWRKGRHEKRQLKRTKTQGKTLNGGYDLCACWSEKVGEKSGDNY